MTFGSREISFIAAAVGKALLTVVVALFLPIATWTQCERNPNNHTSLRFANESSFPLTFYIDDDEEGVSVLSGMTSGEIDVMPGEHVLRARAIVRGVEVWVWTVNDVQRGRICTWTVADPPRDQVTIGLISSSPKRGSRKWRAQIDDAANVRAGSFCDY